MGFVVLPVACYVTLKVTYANCLKLVICLALYVLGGQCIVYLFGGIGIQITIWRVYALSFVDSGSITTTRHQH